MSVIIPARNEEACLGACLRSLTQHAGVSVEVIVVDDGSTDHTREIAQSFSGVRVIDAVPLPQGWTGKNNAVWTGAQAARGEWLLFTDADTVHAPGSLSRAVEEAQKQGAALLSYSPQQEVHGFWEKAIMPVIFAELASTYRPSDVSNPASPATAANGQYLLVSRDTYDAVGGHAAIAGTLLEDVALARAVKRSGRRIFFRYGADAVRTSMYRSFGQLREGWTKNLALLFPSPLRLAAQRLVEFVLIVGCATGTVLAAAAGNFGSAALAGSLAIALLGLFAARIRKAHFSWDADLLALAGLPVFSYLLLRSRISHRRGGVSWKGRMYPSSSQSVSAEHALATTTWGQPPQPALSAVEGAVRPSEARPRT